MDRSELRRIKQHLMSWGTGQEPPATAVTDGAATIVVSDPGHLPEVIGSDLVGTGTVVLAPGTYDTPGVVGFDGSLDEPGGEASLGDEFFLQTQDYATSEFMSILGPTLVRVGNTEDFRLFLADADRALEEGVFPDFAIAPALRFADVPGLGHGPGIDGPGLRLHVSPEGRISTAPGGSGIGRVGDSLSALRAAWGRANGDSTAPCAVCLGEAVPEAERAAALRERPWLGRYLTVVEALRTMNLNNIADLRVSGFGGRITEGLAGEGHDTDLRDDRAPVVMWNSESGYVYDPGTRKVFVLEHVAASAAELLVSTGSRDRAAQYAPLGPLARVEDFLSRSGAAPTAALAGV
ncbi:daptide biosynthesis RiPP recognition protein [Nocardiopsis sp. FIRDI 009]|uniref:daptide biosynthesis RiPP recognition protein n=1 Tax=Nocardiopsis sp. FIRDI 009 TaxID=714197 RepID=UPI000E271C4A|nr:daptide biosynthesis RiPP recognition protein [Nocardiopsis sp. FIRDI 009]